MSSCASSLDDGLLFEDKINGITVYTKSLRNLLETRTRKQGILKQNLHNPFYFDKSFLLYPPSLTSVVTGTAQGGEIRNPVGVRGGIG